ncbi:MAG: hypothetical protein HOQ11_07695, partial [Gemmatimonadaceae bacterium]|nr:hypothetical protein [Gemmatimonadaceae bacterium]
MRIHRHRVPRSGATLAELLVILAIVALIATLLLPSLARVYDGVQVRGAARDVMMIFFSARARAIDDARMTSVSLDATTGRVLLVARGEPLLVRPVGVVPGVRIATSRPTATSFPDGLGRG